MACVFKCDRCGGYYDNNIEVKSKGRIKGRTITGLSTLCDDEKDEWFDLCDTCISDFFKFMEGRKNEID